MPNVAIAQCIHRMQHPANAISIAAALSQLGYPAMWMPPQSDGLITRSRAIAASNFLEAYPNGDVLVFIDDDIAFDPVALRQLVDTCMETREIACGLYVVRDTAAPHPAIACFPNQTITIEPEAQRTEVLYGATGFMAIHRSVLETMREVLPWVYSGPQWFWPFFDVVITPEGEYLSEDYAFCHRARSLGIHVWLDPRIELRHEGSRSYTIKDLASSGSRQRVTMTIDEGGPDQTDVIGDLAAWLEMPRQHVADLVGGVELNTPIAASWEKLRPEGADQVRDFYISTGDLWTWELAKFNTGPSYLVRVMPTYLARGNVLDFGGGIGTLTIHLANSDRRMHYLDVEGPHRRFAEFRFKRHKLQVLTYGALQEVPDDSMDAVVATDVLEHIHPDAIYGTVKEFARILRQGGRLIEVSDFDSHDAGMPQHFETRSLWERAFTELGFEWADSHLELKRKAVPA